MFSNRRQNFPPQYNQYSNASNFNYNSGQFYQQQQPTFIDIGSYVPPSLNNTNPSWAPPTDIDVTYERGSPVVRQQNNQVIDNYYQRFIRPPSAYSHISPQGLPTVIDQDLDEHGRSVTTKQATTGNPAVTQEPPKTQSAGKVEQKQSPKQSPPAENGAKINKEQINKDANSTNQQQMTTTDQTQRIAPAAAATNSNSQTSLAMKNPSNPVVFFDIEIDNQPRGRLVMELFQHVLPKTTQNFLLLCSNDRGFGYHLSYFHRIIPGFMAQGGDFENSNGTGGYSIYGQHFEDEGFPFKHDRPGLLSMANSGPNTNGSQFFVTFVPCPHLDGKHVVFGQVLQGFHLLNDFQLCGSDEGEATREVKISNSGRLQ